jgi:hypothetical protein
MVTRKDIAVPPAYEPGQITGKPLEHYSEQFASLDPAAIAARTRAPYDQSKQEFTLTIMGTPHHIHWPDATFAPPADPYTKILMLRYLCEARYAEPTGNYIAYGELPWGSVYNSNFQGRVIRRFLYEFGRDLAAFKEIMEQTPGLGAEPQDKCDIGYKFDFMNGLPMKVLVWESDDEFPASAQMLYDQSVASAYTAEDIAVAGDLLINRLKSLRRERHGGA